MTTLIYKIDFRTEKLTRDKEEHIYSDEMVSSPRITILNVCAPKLENI